MALTWIFCCQSEEAGAPAVQLHRQEFLVTLKEHSLVFYLCHTSCSHNVYVCYHPQIYAVVLCMRSSPELVFLLLSPMQ